MYLIFKYLIIMLMCRYADLKGVHVLEDLSYLSGANKIWEEWRFEPWKNSGAEGLRRRVSLIKSGLLGEIARYYVDDYIVWKYRSEDPRRIFKTACPETDLMSQRYLFLKSEGKYFTQKKSFMLGLRGFIEIHMYNPGEGAPKAIEDLAYLVLKAGEVVGQRHP